jgi:hypothetical protein
MPSDDLVQPSGKDTGVATLLSCVIPGSGQIYLGQTHKGIVIMVGGLLICWAGGLLGPLMAVDAFRMAEKLEEGKPIGKWEFFWNN